MVHMTSIHVDGSCSRSLIVASCLFGLGFGLEALSVHICVTRSRRRFMTASVAKAKTVLSRSHCFAVGRSDKGF